MTSPHISWMACAAMALCLPAQAIAQVVPMVPPASGTVPQGTWLGKPVAAVILEGHRGGTEIVRNDMKLTGTTAGNTAINVATGTNAISAGAFSSMSGMPLVIQNSGANVLIQNAVILNLQMN